MLDVVRRALLWLLASVAIVLHGWFLDSHFASVQEGPSLEWLFIVPWPGRLAIALTAGLAMVLTCGIADHRSRHPGDGLFALSTWKEREVVTLFALFLSCLVLPIAIRHADSEVAPILGYLLVDLRWWFTLGVLWLAVVRVDPIVRAFRRWASPVFQLGRRCPLEYIAGVVAMTACLSISPANRFELRRLVGDEPKYLRQAENLLQGNGFDMRHLQAFDELPGADRTRLLRSIGRLPAAVAREVRAMASDLPATLRGGGILAASGTPLPNWFIEGKNGGLYEVHNPGLGFLLVPGYALDRELAPVRVRRHLRSSQRHFPSRLIATSLVMLALFGAWTAVGVRLFLRVTGRPVLAGLVGVVAFGTLPVAPFNFQIYPEVPAGLIATAVAGYLLFGTGSRRAFDLLAGAATGFLPWLYPRFIPLTLVLGGWVAIGATRAENRQRVAWFFVGCVAVLAPLALYYYNITGSVLPTSTYLSRGIDPFHPARVIGGLAGFAFDRHYGVLPNAPVYLLAVPGMWWAARAQPRVFSLLGLLVLALAVMSAGHATWFGGGAGPARLIVAIVPFLALPIAYTVGRFRHSTVFRMLAGLLLIISLDNLFSYNRESRLLLADASFSGWKPNLLFPVLVHANDAQAAEAPRLLWTWVAIVAVLAAVPALLQSRLWRFSDIRGPSAPLALLTAGTVFVAFSASLGLLQSERFDRRYLERPDRARYQAEATFLRRGCLVCLSSRGGPDTTIPAQASRLTITPEPPRAALGEPIAVSVTALGPASQPAWGEVAVDFGDGARLAPVRVVGDGRFTHEYSAAGAYRITTMFTTPARVSVERTVAVLVEPGPE